MLARPKRPTREWHRVQVWLLLFFTRISGLFSPWVQIIYCRKPNLTINLIVFFFIRLTKPLEIRVRRFCIHNGNIWGTPSSAVWYMSALLAVHRVRSSNQILKISDFIILAEISSKSNLVFLRAATFVSWTSYNNLLRQSWWSLFCFSDNLQIFSGSSFS